MDCLFCRIVAGEIPAKKVFEDADTFAFEDITPKAPTHILQNHNIATRYIIIGIVGNPCFVIRCALEQNGKLAVDRDTDPAPGKDPAGTGRTTRDSGPGLKAPFIPKVCARRVAT